MFWPGNHYKTKLLIFFANKKIIDRFVLGDDKKYVTPIAFAEKDKMTTPVLEGLAITIEDIFK